MDLWKVVPEQSLKKKKKCAFRSRKWAKKRRERLTPSLSLSLLPLRQLFSLKFNCKVIARGWRFMEVEFHEFKTTSFLKKKNLFHSFSFRLCIYLCACVCVCILPSSLFQVSRWHLVRRGGKRRHNSVFQTLRNTLKIPFRPLENLESLCNVLSIIPGKESAECLLKNVRHIWQSRFQTKVWKLIHQVAK